MPTIGRGPVYRYYPGSYGSVKGKHEHQFRAISRGTDPLNKYLVLSACALCSATKVDDLNPDNKDRLRLQRERRKRLVNKRGEG